MSASPEPSFPAMLRTMKIVAGALIVGVLVFLGVVLYLVHVQNQGRGQNPPGNAPMVSYVAAGFLAVVLPVSFLVPRLILASAVQRIARGNWQPSPHAAMPATDEGKLLVVRLNTLIVGMAPLEGACFFGCIAYLMEAQPLALAVVAVGLVLMLLRFPTEGRVQSWLGEQMDRIDGIRRQL